MDPMDLTLEQWLEATAEATLAIAPTLGYDHGRVTGQFESLRAMRSGAYIPMICDRDCLQIGLVADTGTCQDIAKAILGMRATDGDLSLEDLADAIGEVVNMLAGGVKTRVIDKDPSVRLGLPVFVQGQMLTAGRQESAVAELELGAARTQLVVFRQGR